MQIIIGDECVEDVSLLLIFEGLFLNLKQNFKGRILFMLFQECVRLYELWSKIKEDKKEEHYQYLKERVSLQHEIIKRQDKLFEIHRAKIEQRQLQV